MDRSSSLSSIASSKVGYHNINRKYKTEKRSKYEVLKIICDTYEISLSEYMQQALVEAMRFDIEEGNFCDALLERIGDKDGKKDNSSPASLALA